MFLMDRFFNGAFLTFGLEVIAFAERDQECTHTQHFSHDKFSLLGHNLIGTNFPLWDKILKWQIFPKWTNSHFGKFCLKKFPIIYELSLWQICQAESKINFPIGQLFIVTNFPRLKTSLKFKLIRKLGQFPPISCFHNP